MRVPASAGAAVLRVREWKLDDLSELEILADAVAEAAKADVVVVCMDACERLPDNLFAWVVAWLPRRPRETGALVAVVCRSGDGSRRPRRAEEYLRSVASARGMEFILEERELPARSDDLPENQGTAAEGAVSGEAAAVTAAAGPQDWRQWGINE